MIWMSKNSKWITLFAFALLVAACFMPWAYYPDLDKSFTGFISENNRYGKPAKLLLIFGSISVIAQFLNIFFFKILNLFGSAFTMAYAISRFVKYSASYSGIKPTTQIGLYLMLIAVFILLMTAVLPSGTVKKPMPSPKP